MSMQYIGIDAGGTKTELLLSDEKGKRLRRALLPGVNAARMPVEQAAEALARGVAQLGGAADCLYAGIAGAGTPELARALRQEMEKRLPEVKRMEVASDAFNAMNGEIGLENGLALWDVLAACTITGAADSTIRDAVPNDIAGLLKRYPNITRICTTGGAAARFYHRLAEPQTGLAAIALPSPSAANARTAFPQLLSAYRAALLP